MAWGKRNRVALSSRNREGIEALRRAISRADRYEVPLFSGGLIGYVSFEAVSIFEDSLDLREPGNGWNYLEFVEPENVAVYDHVSGTVYYNEMPDPRDSEVSLTLSLMRESPDDLGYMRGVEKIKDLIYRGYTFQTVLSKMYEFRIEGDALRFYERLRSLNPSPYMFYIKMGDHEIIGSSPEMLFKTTAGHVETYPIAGTRSRGSNDYEDVKLEMELLSSEKDRAEHLMLVDLARNDLGKVCVPGTVRVPELMFIEKYSHVQHLVSKVVGILDDRRDALDVLEAMFPAGTVSGAPKPISIRILSELEEEPRGPYAGAVGFFSANGDSELAITIRSGFSDGSTFRIQAGAGVVYDSTPLGELNEVKQKLMALRVAMGVGP